MTKVEASGLVLVDKPAGKTSFAMVRVVRRLTGIKKVGHAGTLDPFATGLLVICIGRPATRMIGEVMAGTKHYLATLELGKVSSTQDPEGEIVATGPWPAISQATVDRVFARFHGMIMQVPPAFSALKHKGKPLYHYARRGVMIEKAARPVHIHHLQWLDRRNLVDETAPSLTVRVCCGKGTYIRSLAADIGDALGCGAYLSQLRRVASGCFSVEQSVPGIALFGDEGGRILSEAMLDVEQVRKYLQCSDGRDSITC